jgi:hypothetical protein
MGYIFVTARRKNTISCGLQSNFQKLNVHNLFIRHLSNSGCLASSKNKRGENLSFLPLLLEPTKQDLSIKIYLTAFFNKLPALNFATRVAGILISLPVWGFLPVLALLFATENVPNPVKASLSPFFNAFITVLVNALMAFSADAFEILASFPMLAINSAFVIQTTSFFKDKIVLS